MANGKCQKHPKKKPNFHCSDCDQDLCVMCAKKEHKGHNMIPYTKYLANLKMQ